MTVEFQPGLAPFGAEQPNAAKKNERTPEESAQLREAAQRFEELMLRQLFVQMQRSAAVDGDKPMANEFYGDMFAEKMAENAANQGGIGIAEVLMRSWGVEEVPAKGDLEWSPEQLEEFARYSPPVEGTFAASGDGSTLTVEARETTAVAPRAGRLRLDDNPRIEHPGGWVTRFDGLDVDPALDGAWVEKGESLGRGALVRARIEGPTTHWI